MADDKITSEIRDGYTLVVPVELGVTELEELPARVEDLLFQKKQDVVLSLRHVETVFSMHLTVFVQIYKLLKGFNLKFFIVDITPAVLNVMQMTQLESLLPLYLSLADYEEARGGASLQGGAATEPGQEPGFSYEITRDGGRPVVVCSGYMSFGESARLLQTELEGFPEFVLDMAAVGYIDTRVLILLSDLASRHRIEIRGASNVLLELFDQHKLMGKFFFT